MAILLKPNEHRLRKPQQWAVRPDATDAPGLWDRAFLVVPFWDNYDNLVADVPAIPSIGAGSEAWSYNNRGLAWGDGTTSGGGRISYGALAGSVGQGQQTITFAGVLNTSDGTQRHLWRFNVSTAPLHVGRWNNASTFQVATTTGLNASWNLSAFTDQFHVFTWVLDGSGQAVDCYVDGVLQSPTGSASAAFTGPASGDHQIFGFFNNFVAMQASMFVAHGRLLTEPEIQRLAVDPFAMVRERRQVWATPEAGGATTGTAAQSFPLLGQSATGTMQPEGTAAQTFPTASQAASGTHQQTITGSAAQTLPTLSQAATGTMGDAPTGTAAQTFPAMSQAATGAQAVTGTAAQSLIVPSQAASGWAEATGSAAQDFPSLAQDASGTHSISVSGTASPTFPLLAQAAEGLGGAPVAGTAAQLMPLLAQAGAGAIIYAATASQLFPNLSQKAFGGIVGISSRRWAVPDASENIAAVSAYQNEATLRASQNAATLREANVTDLSGSENDIE